MVYWRKYGGLKLPTKWGRSSYSEDVRDAEGRLLKVETCMSLYSFPLPSLLPSFRDERQELFFCCCSGEEQHQARCAMANAAVV